MKRLLREICDRETTSTVHEEENTELLRQDSVHSDAEDKLKPSFISSVRPQLYHLLENRSMKTV